MKLDPRALQQVYAQFPSLQVNADRGALETAATRVLGSSGARALLAALADRDTYAAARAAALQALTPAPPGAPLQQPRRAVVSGLSAGGMLAAAVLAKAGYRVDAVELRDAYTRNIQFSSRQALVDELSSIDPGLAERFLACAGPMSLGYRSTHNGVTKEHPREAPRPGDPTAIPKSGEALLEGTANLLVECKALERVLFDWLQEQPNVTVHRATSITLSPPDEQGRYPVTATPRGGEPLSLGAPDLLVVSEGGSSATRKALGIESVATSPGARFIAGVVHEGSGGRAASRYVDHRREDGATERLLSMALGSAKLDKTWVLAEVPAQELFDPGAGLDPSSPEFRSAQQTLVEKYFRDEAALVMEKDVGGAALEGPFEGSRPTLFTLQQRLSKRATAGSNVVGLGDFVGTGHFVVGGGMATATVSHVERLKELVFELELGSDKGAALARYDQGAIADTLAWGRRGIFEFYPDVDREVVSQAWLESVRDWLAGKNKDPLAALEKLLTTASLALPPLGRPAAA